MNTDKLSGMGEKRDATADRQHTATEYYVNSGKSNPRERDLRALASVDVQALSLNMRLRDDLEETARRHGARTSGAQRAAVAQAFVSLDASVTGGGEYTTGLALVSYLRVAVRRVAGGYRAAAYGAYWGPRRRPKKAERPAVGKKDIPPSDDDDLPRVVVIDPARLARLDRTHPSPEQLLSRRLRAEAVRRILAMLPPRDRELLERYAEGTRNDGPVLTPVDRKTLERVRKKFALLAKKAGLGDPRDLEDGEET